MKLNESKGQSLVEFALAVPILLLLLLGLIELGRAWMTRNIMTGAAREAVRIYVVPEGSDNAAKTRAWDVLATAGITSANASVVTSDSGAYSICTVTITHGFQPIFGGFIPGLDCVALVTTTSMRREY